MVGTGPRKRPLVRYNPKEIKKDHFEITQSDLFLLSYFKN